MTNAAEFLDRAVETVRVDFDIPELFVQRSGSTYTIDLPDGTALVAKHYVMASGDGVEVSIFDGSSRPAETRIDFSGASLRVLVATMSAIVAESLED